MANQMSEPSPVEKSCPSCLHLYQLNQKQHTFCQHFVHVIDKLETENDIVSHVEVNSHAVDASFFDFEPPHLLWVVVFKLEGNVSSWSALTNEVNLDNLYFCGLVFFQILFFNVSQKGLFVSLKRLIILILTQDNGTRHSISDTLTLKF